MVNTIIENEMISTLAMHFLRSPLQINRLQESDAELIRLPGCGILLALTTDGIVEEIESGLYTDPYLIGWMTVMVYASDLAAVGAEPLGLLINETMPPAVGEEFVGNLQQGIQDACTACGLYILGGDTNFSSRLHTSACAVGIVPDGMPLMRRGCKPGDILYASGPLGLGSIYASSKLGIGAEAGSTSIRFQPSARLREAALLRGCASCCMDTSDGVLATLDQLMRLNNMGFVLDASPGEFLHPDVVRFTKRERIPWWMTLSGPHGEFELLFAVAPADEGRFLSAAGGEGWAPIRMGRIVEQTGVWWSADGKQLSIDTGRIRNLFMETHGDISEYMKGLFLIGERDGLNSITPP